MLRGNASAAVENVALWHERDISHSGAERVILPDSTILLDYLQHLALRVVNGLVVHADRMRANLDLTHGALFSQRVLLALVAGGMQRDDAYRIVQEDAQRAWDTATPLRDLLAARDLGLDLDEIFDLAHYTRHAREVVGRLDADRPGGRRGSRLTQRRARARVGAMYDYVIVGAGSAGCVLANRLSEDPDVQVLLLEAGPPDTADFIHIPAAFSALFRSQNDWDLGTGYEPGLDDRRVYLPRGKTLGGSSSLNAMIYIRGNPADYDEWSELGWGWDDVLPYFLRAEDNARGASEHHGVGGPLRVSDSLARTGLSQAFLDAAAARGLPASEDFNGRQPGRHRLVPADHARRPARQHGGLLPAPGRWTARTSRSRPTSTPTASSSTAPAPSASWARG